MDSKCFKQIKQIFAEVICANPSNPVNQAVKDKDKSTLFVPCMCQVVKSAPFDPCSSKEQSVVILRHQILGFIRIFFTDTD